MEKTYSCRQNRYFGKRPYVHTSSAEITYLFTCKKITLMSSTETIISFHITFFTIEASKKMYFVELIFAM